MNPMYANQDQEEVQYELGKPRIAVYASVGNDAKRVQSALCTRMRIVFFWIRLGLKTSVCREVCHCHVYCTRL